MAASDAKKRRVPPKVAAMKDKKRKRLEEGEPEQKAAPPRKNVRLDELSWNQIQMPDKLDDYEGFFGLEEIDDVEVVKDGTGKMSFVSSGSGKADDKATSNGTAKTSSNEANAEDETVPGDDFEGFSDHEAAPAKSAPKSIVKATAQTARDPKAKPDKVKPVKAVPAKKAETKSKKATDKSAFDLIQDQTEADDEGVDVSAWKNLKLSPDTLAGLSKLKFATPTPIQKQAIPEILAGHDLVGKASTGSGKTLTFGIPIFETYLDRKIERAAARKKDLLAPLALVVSPTRELAHQISQHLQSLSNGLPNERPVIATLTGGLSVQKQQRQLKNADIVIGTPGRLWEIISGGKDLIERMKKVQYLVLDEADRLLSTGHFKDLEEILNALDRTVSNDEDEDEDKDEETTADAPTATGRQTLIFSATFAKDLQHKLAQKSSRSGTMDKKESLAYLMQRLRFRTTPKFIDADPNSSLASKIREGIVECGSQEKDLYTYALQLLHPTARTLVFVNSISSVRRLVPFLQLLALPALALHSQMPQKARLRSVERFTASPGAIMVATDVAARGLDIKGIDLVVHYHLPRQSDAYIHRSGRTARAGAGGSSILLCGPDEVAGVRRLVGKTGTTMRSVDLDRRVVQRLRARADLAKRIADVEGAKEKKRSSDGVWKQAAEDLGVEYDSEELEASAKGRQGRGSGRRQRDRENREVGQDQVRAMRGELKGLLAQRVNVGVSERYITGGTIDIDALLGEQGKKTGEFLGAVRNVGMDE